MIENVYQWGFSSNPTINNPYIETLDNFLARKNGIFTPLTKQGAINYLLIQQNTNNIDIKFFIGTQEEFEKFRNEKPTIDKADKGQLVENAIELNDAIKGYLDEKLKTIQQNVNDKVGILLSPALVDQTLKQKHWNDLLSIKSKYQTNLGYYKIAISFERSLGISVSQDKDHPVHFFDENTFVQILTEIKNLPPQNPLEIPQRPSLWSDITKMIGVEETYEVKQVVDEWKKILNLIHSGISYTAKPTPHVPDLTGNGIGQGI